ncbi:PAS domain S-box protein [Pseudanabaena galeata UHCC 0370]|uniref:histidine kinase n=1 Tax=Pseudanabaena galeata UHCC 0370 TaxID=3110310 RepID=A0ABU5TEI5_9CYAN|nr:PAS domain S-box protein [Pseudanabaena galeata]MEA5476684.1 PAS domain S-box protein [Pseudanabaena galeata UHCC 0370]
MTDLQLAPMIIDRKKVSFRSIPLQWLMLFAFAVQIFGAVGLVAYLSYRSGQESVNKLANRLKTEISTRVTEKTKTYLQTIDQVNKNNISALRRNIWNFDDFSSQERQAWEQMQLNSLSPITIIGFGTPSGGHRAVELLKDGTFSIRAAPNGGGAYRTFTTNPNGSPAQVTETSVMFDSRQRPWYQVAVQSKKAVWTSVYPHIYTGELLVALAEPIYDLNNGNLLGVTYGIRSLEAISKFLQSIDIKAGSVFIMERDETLVATSSMVQKPYQLSQNETEQKLLKASDSQNPQIHNSVKYLRDRFGSLANIRQLEQFEFDINGDRQIAQVLPIFDRNGLDWVIVVVIPESELIADIQANQVLTILLCGITLIVATGISVITNRWIAKPILRLSQASKAISNGEWQETLPENQAIAEIRTLAKSFNQMTKQVHQSLDRVEIALKESEEKYRVLFKIAPIGISITDKNGFILESNDIAESWLGEPQILQQLECGEREPSPNIIRPDGSVMPVEEYACIKALRNQAPTCDVEMGIVCVDGVLRWFSVSAAPITSEYYGVMLIHIDISDRKQAERSLQQTLDQLNYHIENSPLATIRWDQEFRVAYWSKQAEEIFGWSAEEVLGKNLYEWPFIFEDDRDQVNQAAKQLMGGFSITCQNRNYHKDGSIIYCEWYNSALADKSGNLISMFSLAHDISDRQRLEKELIHSRNLREAIFNESSDALFLVDSETLLTIDCNQQAVKLFEVDCKDDLINIEGHILQKRLFTPQESVQIIQEVNQKGFWSLEVEYITRKGREFWGDLSAKQITFEDQRFHLVRVVDITIRKHTEIALAKAKAAAEEATRAKSAFLASMSHEIRTPMNGVIGMTQILEMTKLTSDQQEFVKTIKDSGEALLTIINDILDFSKIESGMLEIEAKDFFLEEVVRGVCNLLENQAIARQVDLQYAIATDIPQHLIGDHARLRQILLNLVGNAVKFTQNGQVMISVSGKVRPPSPSPRETAQQEMGSDREDYELSFAIADTGIGIQSDRLDRLFQPFTQADPSISRNYGGTGLGLAISKRLAELMGGTIWVESLGQIGGSPPLVWKSQSRSPQGATFYFNVTLSIYKTVNNTQAVSAQLFEIDNKMAERHPLRILVVDDNLVNQKIAKLMFARLGYHSMEIANNGLEAVQAVKNHDYDLVLMDVQMPIMDGLTATKAIRTELRSNVRIIAMTADAMPEDRQACFDAGMDDYISKPVNIQAIMKLVSSIC